MTLCDRQKMLAQMMETVQEVVPVIIELYEKARLLKTEDQEWIDLMEQRVVPAMRKLMIVRSAAEHCLDLTQKPFISESIDLMNQMINLQIEKHADKNAAEVAMCWARKAYSLDAMKKDFGKYF